VPVLTTRLVGAALALAMAGCGSAPPPRPRAMPDDAARRDAAVAALGEAMWTALSSDRALELLATDHELAVLLDGRATARIEDRRPGFRARLGEVLHRIPSRLAGASYLGVCAQDAREEAPHGPLGLTARTWIVRRILVAGRIASTSRRIALWIDGPFAFDGERFVALELENVEEPRWEHSDLEIAACDLSEGL
jgi:hypothetical protein